MTVAPSQRQTRAEAVRDRMRADILSGTIRPGSRLMFPDVCARYGISVGVAREALATLVSQGLVRAVAHQGYTVTPISTADLKALSDARSLIEPLVLKLAVQRGGVEWEASVMSTHHVMTRTPHLGVDEPSRPTSEWVAAHAAFHDALFSGCSNPKLIQITRQLSEEAALYRRWSDSLTVGKRDIAGEHEALRDAALAGDAEKSAALLLDHIQRTANSIIDYTEASSSDHSAVQGVVSPEGS